mmetsp:Transcript_18542/g.43600  ORF Transcript_18542/g.43600 Transcript_18542/m.43600 type:complete len:500 (+) Transcript_18542:58-1557(+)
MSVDAERADDIVKPAKLQPRQWCVRFSCVFFNVLSGVVNGYDVCITTGILDSVDRDLQLCDTGGAVGTCFLKEAVMSFACIGGLGARLCGPTIADRYGRSAALFLADVLILVSVAMQSTTKDVPAFFLARFLIGAGMGLAFVVTPTYLCEIAPRTQRGLFVCLHEVAVCVGCLLGLHVSSRDTTEWQWHHVIAFAALPAAVQLVFVCVLPESPRWFALRGDVCGLDRASALLGLEAETAELRKLVHTGGVTDLSSTGGSSCCRRNLLNWQKHRRPLMIALGLAGCNSATGTFAIQTYAYDLLRVCGVQEPGELLPVIGWMKLIGALLAMFTSDSKLLGRRRLVIGGSFFCTICDVLLALHLAVPTFLTPELAASCVFFRILSWNAGYGGVQFVAVSEILPSEVRSSFMGQSQVAASVIDILIFQLFETLLFMDKVATFVIFAAINFGSCLFAFRCLPDLRGMSLEEIHAGSSRSYGVLEEEEASKEPQARVIGAIEPCM